VSEKYRNTVMETQVRQVYKIAQSVFVATVLANFKDDGPKTDWPIHEHICNIA
jgi:hypothetical protein